MDNLKKFIDDNLDAFDTEEPSALHIKSFESKLRASKKKKGKVLQFAFILSGVAVLLFGYILIFNGNDKESMYCNPEVYEVASYYSNQLDSKLDELKTAADNTDGETRQELLGQIDIFHSESDRFLNSLCSEGAIGEQKMFIIDKHYTLQLEVIEQLLKMIV